MASCLALHTCRLVAELLSERLDQHAMDEGGRRLRRKGACDVWSMVEGTGAYAISAGAAREILASMEMPRGGPGRRTGDTTSDMANRVIWREETVVAQEHRGVQGRVCLGVCFVPN